MTNIEDQVEKVLTDCNNTHLVFIHPQSKDFVKNLLVRAYLDILLKQLSHKNLHDTKL